MLKIRYFEEDDKSESISLLQTIFSKKQDDNFEKFWEWEYLSNLKDTGGNPVILVSELDDKIVGILAGIKSRLNIGNSSFDCIWLTDYGTHPDYRLKAGAFKLAHRAMEDFDILLGFGNPNSSMIGKRIGFSYFSVPIVANVFSLKNILSSKVKQAWLIKGVDAVWQAFRKISSFRSGFKADKVQIEEISFFDERFDTLWDRVKEDYPVICFRNKDYLRWRYGFVPGYKYKIFGAINSDGLSGYIVLRLEERTRFRTGLIIDCLSGINNVEIIRCLTKKALNYFAEESVDIVKCLQTGIPAYDNALKKLGFIFHSRNINVFIKSKSDKVTNAFLSDRRNWFLSIGDSDLDFYCFY